MTNSKSFNRSPKQRAQYHALMESILEDKSEADKDEGPSVGSDRGKEYPFDLSKPLSLIMVQGRQVVHVDYFINNDLEYLKGGSSSKKYMTPIIKTKDAKYDILDIKDTVPSL
nr:hypothetical protein [Tanacetum cinerariifolium]